MSFDIINVDEPKIKGEWQMAELWDAYDVAGNKLDFDLQRGQPIPKGVYHMVVVLYVFSQDGKTLITQRDSSKAVYPLKWENPGGAVVKGEMPLSGAIRELREETGIVVEEKQLQLAYTEISNVQVFKGFAVSISGDENIVLQQGETADYKWLPYEEFLQLIKTDDFVDSNCDRFFRHKEEIDCALSRLRKIN